MNLALRILSQITQALVILVVAPLLLGWVNQCRAWLQNKRGAGVLQPYRNFAKLFEKDVVLAHNASVLFRATPYILFGCMVLAAGIVPVLATDLPFARAADVIALVGIFALARVFLALAAMDIGTAFGTMGARREMLIAFMAEPALLMVFFTASLISQSTSLNTIVTILGHGPLAIYPSLAFAATAFLMVLLAENARIPIDNPATHLELTMVHEAMILEYSARHLALIEWASSIKLTLYVAIGLCIFAPWGIAAAGDLATLISVWDWPSASLGQILAYPLAFVWLAIKLLIAGAGLALLETVSAKMRIFRAPEFLATAFLLAVLGMLVHFLLEA